MIFNQISRSGYILRVAFSVCCSWYCAWVVAGGQGNRDRDVHNERHSGDAARGWRLRTPVCGSKRRGVVGRRAGRNAEERLGTQFLDRLPLPQRGWHSLQRRREWTDFPPWPSDQQHPAAGSRDRQGGDRGMFRQQAAWAFPRSSRRFGTIWDHHQSPHSPWTRTSKCNSTHLHLDPWRNSWEVSLADLILADLW